MHLDGTIWTMSNKTVVWIELTTPWEDNMTLQHSEKYVRYTRLKVDCEANGLMVYLLCVKVGRVSRSREPIT